MESHPIAIGPSELRLEGHPIEEVTGEGAFPNGAHVRLERLAYNPAYSQLGSLRMLTEGYTQGIQDRVLFDRLPTI